MSWTDSIEFSSSQPLTSSLHMSMSADTFPLSSSPYTSTHADHMRTLERDFCSNFSCCGLDLADLHELVKHAEESHAVDGSGMSVYPRCKAPSISSSCTSASDPDTDMDVVTPPDSASVSTFPATPYSSILFNCPPPHSPALFSPPSPPDFCTELANHLRNAPFEHDMLADFDTFDTDFSPAFDSNSNSSSSSHSSLHSSFSGAVGLPPSLFTVTSLSQSSSSAKRVSGAGLEVASLPTFVDRKGTLGKLTSKIWNPSERRRSQGANSIKREKLYRCPEPGCTKTYLNPNGLKYHVDKGTCKIDPIINRAE